MVRVTRSVCDFVRLCKIKGGESTPSDRVNPALHHLWLGLEDDEAGQGNGVSARDVRSVSPNKRVDYAPDELGKSDCRAEQDNGANDQKDVLQNTARRQSKVNSGRSKNGVVR